MIQRRGKFYLKDYVRTLSGWIYRKGEFIEKLFTNSAREISEERQKRKRNLYTQLEMEEESYDLNTKCGLLGMINFFVGYVSDPSLPEELEFLKREWIPQREAWVHEERGIEGELAEQSLRRVADFCSLLEKEIEGKL